MISDLNHLSKEELIELLLNEKQKVTSLSETVHMLRKYIFAKKSEKITAEDKIQGFLFTELEENSDDSFEEVKPPSEPKNKPGRKPLPDDIPKEKVVHDLASEETKCPCCSKERPLIQSKPTKELVIIPEKIIVKEHWVNKYGPCNCEEFQSREDLSEIIEAKAPKRLIPGGIASPSLIAHVVTNKFCDHLPFYRQERIFQRIGVYITRQNMSNWSMSVSKKCADILEYMRTVAIKGDLINMDETSVQVLNEKDRDASQKSYMWVFTGGSDNKKVVLFNYSPTRNEEIPVKLLNGFKGILQTDGYAAYNKAVKKYGLWHMGCLTHARRKFHAAASATKKKGKGHKGVNFYSRLYEVDTYLRKLNLSPEEFIKKRRELSIPIWQEFRIWLVTLKQMGLPPGLLSTAVTYSLNQYKSLVRYLKYPEIKLDNNVAENAIRPFCIGRKNWLFNNTPKGAYSSAALYSLIETAKINGVEPRAYLNFLFSELPKVNSNTNLDSLMPWNMP